MKGDSGAYWAGGGDSALGLRKGNAEPQSTWGKREPNFTARVKKQRLSDEKKGKGEKT